MKYLDDVPAAQPVFAFPIIASAIAELLAERYDAARVVAIHGPWGSGKTTLMNAVGAALKEKLGANAVVLSFNAWKFDERGALARALVLSVIGELREQPLDDELKARLDELEQALYHAFSVTEKGPLSINWRTVVVEVISLLLSLVKLDFVADAVRKSTGILSRIFLWGDAKDGKKEKEEKEPVMTAARVEKLAGVLERTSITRSVLEVRSTEQFLTKFREMVTALTVPGRRLFVLIDDLDRCLPENALQVFESIRLFLDAPGCGYIIALDREVIRRGLSIRYGKSPEAQIFINPDEYIEKTVSLSLDLPRLSPADALTIVDDYGLELTPAEQSLILTGLGTNPRRLKRYMNTLSLQLRIARLAYESHAAAEITDKLRPIFIKLSLIGYRYSPLMQAAVEREDSLLELQGIATQARGKKKAADKAKVYSEAQASIRFDLTADLRALMEHDPIFNGGDGSLRRLIHWFRTQPVIGQAANP